jgi:plastocyanin
MARSGGRLRRLGAGRRLRGLLLACLLPVSGLGAASAEPALELAAGGTHGKVVGTIRLGPQLVARRVKFSLYSDPARSPRLDPAPSLTDELGNVVVYLESAPADATRPPVALEPPQVGQEQLRFTPHVLAVVKGTTVEFPNRDTVFHNVFSLSRSASFDLGRYPHGVSKSVRFTTPGVVKIFCHIHSDMSAIVVVLDNPYFSAPDRQGRFVIEGIPPGEYTIVAWHERARLLSRRVRIDPGGITVADFDIPLTESADGG